MNEQMILVGSNFGDRFLTRDGHLAIYRDVLKTRGDERVRHLLLVDKSPELTMVYDGFGKCITRKSPKFDIISRYEDDEYLKDIVKIRSQLDVLQIYNHRYGTEYKYVNSIADDYNNTHFNCRDLSEAYERGFFDSLRCNCTFNHK